MTQSDERLRTADPEAVADCDPRVAAVLDVLAGEPLDDVARRWTVEPALLRRWVRAFVEAGTAQVTNRPVGDIARQRDRFLTTFMHGLRSPLALAQMWVGLLRDVPRDVTATREIAEHLQAVLDQLDERAMDVELLTAAMLGRLSLEPRRVDIAALTRTLEPLPHLADDAAALELVVDPSLVSRLLRDLWTVVSDPREGVHPAETSLTAHAIGPWVEIRMVRVGASYTPRELQALFDPFDRTDDDARVTVGLYLARALTVVHGGTVGVDQHHDRTTFGLRLPVGHLVSIDDADDADDDADLGTEHDLDPGAVADGSDTSPHPDRDEQHRPLHPVTKETP